MAGKANVTVVDKRTVHTDALDTLGTILKGGNKRDAIHLAVEPVVAGELLYAGQSVGRFKDGTYGIADAGKFLGIVDPFIKGPIQVGQTFWLVLFPRQITSLYHVWEHPDFPVSDDAQRNLDVATVQVAELQAKLDQLQSEYNNLNDEYQAVSCCA